MHFPPLCFHFPLHQWHIGQPKCAGFAPHMKPASLGAQPVDLISVGAIAQSLVIEDDVPRAMPSELSATDLAQSLKSKDYPRCHWASWYERTVAYGPPPDSSIFGTDSDCAVVPCSSCHVNRAGMFRGGPRGPWTWRRVNWNSPTHRTSRVHMTQRGHAHRHLWNARS